MPRPVPAGWALMAALMLGAAGTVGMDAQAPETDRLFATANALYAEQRYVEAAEVYRAVLSADASRGEAHFFLANTLDNLFVAAHRGQPANDRLLEDARTHYSMAATLLVGPQQGLLRKRSLQFLAALYARDKLNRSEEAETVIRQLMALHADDTGSVFALARILENAGRLADAEPCCRRPKPPRRSGPSCGRRRRSLQPAGRFDDAMVAFARLAQLDPADPQPFYRMATFYEEKLRKDSRWTRLGGSPTSRQAWRRWTRRWRSVPSTSRHWSTRTCCSGTRRGSRATLRRSSCWSRQPTGCRGRPSPCGIDTPGRRLA